MASEKSLYWLAVALSALILGNSFINQPWLSRHKELTSSIAMHGLQIGQEISDRTVGFVKQAAMIVDNRAPQFVRAQNAMACAQARMASAEATLAVHQATLARLQSERAQLVRMGEFHFTCPRHSLRMSAPLHLSAPIENPL